MTARPGVVLQTGVRVGGDYAIGVALRQTECTQNAVVRDRYYIAQKVFLVTSHIYGNSVGSLAETLSTLLYVFCLLAIPLKIEC